LIQHEQTQENSGANDERLPALFRPDKGDQCVEGDWQTKIDPLEVLAPSQISFAVARLNKVVH
jgi:hypothetical protein